MGKMFEINLKGVDDFQKNLTILGRELTRKAVGEALQDIMEQIMKKAENNSPFSSGSGVKSSYVTDAIDAYESLIVEGGFKAEYFLYNHEGTKAHMPPIEPIMKWVVQKGLASSGESAEDIAWRIAVTIKAFGTTPNPFFLEVLNELRPKLNNMLKNAIQRKFPKIQRKLR